MSVMTEASTYRMGIYEKALKPQALPLMFADAASAGYDNFEISLDETDWRLERLNWSAQEFLQTQTAALNSGIQLYSACFSGQRKHALGSADPIVEKRAMELMRKGIDFCGRLGVRVLQITGSDVYYEQRTSETEKRYIDNLAIGVRMAEQAGVMLAIEPVEKFITSIAKAMEIVRQIDSPWLQIYPDAANLTAEGFDPVHELELGRGHLVGLHIRDARSGTSYNLPWGSGTLDFCALFRQLERMNFASPILVELWHEKDPDYLQRARESRKYVVNKIIEARSQKTGDLLGGDSNVRS